MWGVYHGPAGLIDHHKPQHMEMWLWALQLPHLELCPSDPWFVSIPLGCLMNRTFTLEQCRSMATQAGHPAASLQGWLASPEVVNPTWCQADLWMLLHNFHH